MTISRLLDKIIKDDNGCWNYQGAISDKGYGDFNVPKPEGGYKRVRAHRYSYEHYKGELKQGEKISPICNNRRCCNPDHWEITTQRERTKKSFDSGNRNKEEYKQTGEDNRNAQLTWADVDKIRLSVKSNAELAIQYGVSEKHISRIRNHTRWNEDDRPQ